MTVVVFAGPTISVADAEAILPAEYRGPVAQGDVYRAALTGPRAVGIIDGVFHSQPSVWHKEILWALAQGIAVFGAASLGALRAVELAPFGMRGTGAVFEAYRDGALEDDDEVAVAHGDDASDYRPLSEPMVNIRATLAAAEVGGIITPATRAAVERAAKATFYPERRLELILPRCIDAGLDRGEVERLRAWWLNRGAVDQKREDALAMLRAMSAWLAADIPPEPAPFVFQETLEWRRFVASAR